MNLVKAGGTIGGLTLVSRILGFVREMVFARVMGASAAADVFYFAFMLPNQLRRLLGEAAATEDIDGVRAVLQSGQRLELLMARAYERKYGAIADSPEPQTPRLGAITLRVASIDGLRDALGESAVEFDEYAPGLVRVAAEHACGATLLFTESAPA